MLSLHDRISPHGRDELKGRGEWMQTWTGKQFCPADPRPEDVCMADIAHGLSMQCRYGGHICKFFSVAEHSALMALSVLKSGQPVELMAVALLHDAAETYVTDLPHSVKVTIGEPYVAVEDAVQAVIWERYGLTDAAAEYAPMVKDMDRRIIPHEKAALMRHDLRWAADKLEPLEHVEILGLPPASAKHYFTLVYWQVCQGMGWDPEEME